MECPEFSISCRLEEIAHAISVPTGFEIVTLVVSSFAAFGTLAIAWMNLKFIREQSRRDSLRARLEERDRRRPFRDQLVANLEPALNAWEEGKPEAEIWKHLQEGDLIALADTAEAKNAHGFATGFSLILNSTSPKRYPGGWMGMFIRLMKYADTWFEDPEDVVEFEKALKQIGWPGVGRG